MLHAWSHRIDRVISFLSSRPNWDSTTPLTCKRVCFPLLWFGGGEVHNLLAGEGVGESQSDEGTDTVDCCTLQYVQYVFIYVLCAWSSLPFSVSLLHFLIYRKIIETFLLAFGKLGAVHLIHTSEQFVKLRVFVIWWFIPLHTSAFHLLPTSLLATFDTLATNFNVDLLN